MNNKRRGANPYGTTSKRTTDGQPKLSWMIGGGTVAVVLVIAAVVFVWPSGDDGGDGAGADTGAAAAANAEQETASLAISGEDLPTLEESESGASGADEAIGMAVPALRGETFDGSEVAIDGADGRPKMVVFLAHWCPNCQQEVPVVQEWIDDGAVPEGLDLYSVSTAVDSSRPNYPPSNWLSGEGWEPPVLLDNDAADAASAWGLPGYPYFVFVDADGNVWHRGSGQIPRAELERLSTELMSGATPNDAGQVDTGGQTPAELPEEPSSPGE